MRSAWALYGLGVLIVLAGAVYAFNHKPTGTGNTEVSITSSTTTMITLTSSAFEHNAAIPPQFTCDGQRDVNPPLSISGVPEGAKSLALIMDDPDVPKALKPDGMFDHWVLFNMPSPPAGGTLEIASGATVGIPGKNGAGKNQYTGPCPPREYEPSEHRYFFKLYALNGMLSLQAGASKTDVEKAMEGHIIAQTELVGRYKRQ